jgi:hypothetical protein
MAISIRYGLSRVRNGQRLGTGLAINDIRCTAIDGKVRLLVNDRSRLGVSAGATTELVSLERKHKEVCTNFGAFQKA